MLGPPKLGLPEPTVGKRGCLTPYTCTLIQTRTLVATLVASATPGKAHRIRICSPCSRDTFCTHYKQVLNNIVLQQILHWKVIFQMKATLGKPKSLGVSNPEGFGQTTRKFKSPPGKLEKNLLFFQSSLMLVICFWIWKEHNWG